MKTIVMILAIGVCRADPPTLTAEMMTDWDHAWQKSICDHFEDNSLFEEIKACFSYMSNEVYVAISNCRDAAFQNQRDLAGDIKEGCKGDGSFEKYDSCMMLYYNEPSFLSKVVENRITFDCFDDACEKRGATVRLFKDE